MKKNFFKKLAVALALTTAVTSVNVPAAKAATAPDFKSTAVNLTVNQAKWYGTANSADYSTKFKIGNKTVARIFANAKLKKVKVRGLKEGKTTLRADFKNYKTKKVVTQRIPVTVSAPVVEKAEMSAAALKGTTQLAVTLSAADTALTKDSFTVTRKDNATPVTISSISNNGTSVILNLATTLINGKEYTVTLNGKSLDVSVAYGVPATITIEDQKVAPATYTKIAFNVFDANGIDITSEYTHESFDFITDATVVDGKIYLGQVGDTAKVTVTYTGTTPISSKEVTITAAEASLGAVSAYTVAYSQDDSTIRDKVNYTDAKNWISLSDTAGFKLYVQFKDAAGNIVDESRDYNGSKNQNKYEYSLATSSDSILEIDKDGYITPYKEGTAQIKVTCGALVDYVAITVKAERKPTKLEVDTTSVLSRAVQEANSSIKNPEEAELRVKVLDQYDELMGKYSDGNAYVSTESWTVEHVSGSYAVEVDGTLFNTSNKSISDSEKTNTLVFPIVANDNFSDTSTKTEKLKVVYGKLSAYVNYTTKAPLENVSNVKIGAINGIDSNIDNSISFTVYGYDKNGVKNSVIAANTTAAGGLVEEIKYSVKDTYGDNIISNTYRASGAVTGSAVSTKYDGNVSVTNYDTTGNVGISFTQMQLPGSGENVSMPIGKANITVTVKLFTTAAKQTTKTLTGSNTYEVDNETGALTPSITLTSMTVDGNVFGSIADAFNGTTAATGILNIDVNPAYSWIDSYEVIGFTTAYDAKIVGTVSDLSIVNRDETGTVRGTVGTSSVKIVSVVIKDSHSGDVYNVLLNKTVKVVVK